MGHLHHFVFQLLSQCRKAALLGTCLERLTTENNVALRLKIVLWHCLGSLSSHIPW